MQTRLGRGPGQPGAIKGLGGAGGGRAGTSGEQLLIGAAGRPQGPACAGGPRGHHVRGLCAGQGCPRVSRAHQARRSRPGPASLRPPAPGAPAVPRLHRLLARGPGPRAPAAWSAPFSAPKDDWAAAYGPGPAAPTASPAPLAFGPPPDLSAVPAPPGPGPGLLAQPLGGPGAPPSPGAQRRTPYEWMRRSVAAGSGGGSGKDPSLAPRLPLGAGRC